MRAGTVHQRGERSAGARVSAPRTLSHALVTARPTPSRRTTTRRASSVLLDDGAWPGEFGRFDIETLRIIARRRAKGDLVGKIKRAHHPEPPWYDFLKGEF